MAECPRDPCWPEVGCSLGHLNLSNCPVLEAESTAKEDERGSITDVAMPWSGNVLGLTDLGFIAGRTKPIVLAIVGPQNAGKTTLLGVWYRLLERGLRPDDKLRFSGSCSLAGWGVVSSPLRWGPGPVPPAFPPHTSSSNARSPGLLHLAFRQDNDHRRDYLMTDAPGEWFRKWAFNRDDPDAEGARWAADHADAFLLVADREALAGKEMGSARTAIRLLARRLAGELRGRPVALVWTKSDVSINKDMEQAVRGSVLKVIPKAVEFAVSIMSRSSESENVQVFLDLLCWTLNVRRSTVRLPEPVIGNLDPVFTFGAR